VERISRGFPAAASKGRAAYRSKHAATAGETKHCPEAVNAKTREVVGWEK